MRLYLDDDMTAAVLVRLLMRDGHDVQVPADVRLAGRADAVHLTHAISDDRHCLTHNYGDFEELHLLVRAAAGRHAGILVVRRDNDPSRDLTPPGIVRAVRNLERAGVPTANEYIILNHWR